MAYSLKENEAEARARLRAFWHGSSLGRPALLVTANNPDRKPKPWPGPELSPKERDLLPVWQAWQCEQNLESCFYLAEAMPSCDVSWGTLLVTVAVLAGGDYQYSADSAWIKPIPDLYDRPLPRFDPLDPVAESLDACMRRLAGVLGDRGFLNIPVMLDAVTTMSRFRGTGGLCVEMLERPEDVLAWSDALTRLYVDAYEHFYRLACELGYGESCAWLGVMAEGRMEAVQCDFAVTLSPAMFERFVMPDLRRLTDYLDFSLYHLDGTCQMRFLDQLRELPRLNGIRWNPEPPAGSPVRWLDALRAIREGGLCLYVWCSAEEAVTLTRELGPDGLLLSLPRFESRQRAERAIRAIERAS